MHRGGQAVFLDRDGTLLVDRGYMHEVDDLRFLPLVIDGLRSLRRSGYQLVIATNQSGIGRGLFTRSEMDKFHRALLTRLAEADVALEAIYVCPHVPGAGCRCRKPGTALFRRAIRDLSLDPSRSFVVGDRAHDVVAGHRVGCRTVLIRRSYLKRELDELAVYRMQPDHIARNLLEASGWIVRMARKAC